MIVVTGMHRSGTSLTARLLWSAGCDLGDPATFHPGDRWNVDGYFEQEGVLRINRRLTEGPWGRAAYFWPPSSSTISARARALAQELRQTSERYRDCLVKDARFCLTLQAWIDHGLDVQGVILCLRHPLAIAQSLRRRNRIPTQLALGLWKTHLERLLPLLDHLRVRYVSYDRLMDAREFGAEFAPAATLAGAHLSSQDLSQLFRQCVQPNQRHHHSAEAPPLPSWAARTWDELCGRHEAQRLDAQPPGE